MNMEPPRKTEGKRAAGALLCVSAPIPALVGMAAPFLNSSRYGFHASPWDLRMLVPGMGRDDNTVSTTYDFYIEVN